MKCVGTCGRDIPLPNDYLNGKPWCGACWAWVDGYALAPVADELREGVRIPVDEDPVPTPEQLKQVDEALPELFTTAGRILRSMGRDEEPAMLVTWQACGSCGVVLDHCRCLKG